MTAFLESSLNSKNIPFSKILDAIEIQQGIIVQRAPDIYSFSHLTVQEYLTANYFYSPRKMPSLVDKFLFEERWREVFLLLAGISNADDLLILMAEKLQMLLRNSKLLSSIVGWIGELIPNTNDYQKDACKRIVLVSLLLRYKRYDDILAKREVRLEDYATNLLDAIDHSFNKTIKLKQNIDVKEAVQILDIIALWRDRPTDFSFSKEAILSINPEIPLSRMLNGSRHLYRRKLLQPFYTALNAPITIYNLHKKDYEPLIKYLVAFKLIVECKNASLRVSKDNWKKICTSLLSENVMS